MNLHFDSRRVLPWVFVVLAATLSVNLVLGTRQYWLLYSSLEQLGFTVTQMSLQSSSGNMTNILTVVKADNPVDYSGLTVTLISVTTFFHSDGFSLFEQKPVGGGGVISRTLAPHNAQNFTLIISLNQQNATSLSSFYRNHSGNITADSSLYASVSSYLTTLSGSATAYTTQQNVTLT
jgi:hypothetical protein